MVAAAPAYLSPEDMPDAPDVADLVIDDGAPVDSILCEKQQRLLTESLYSSWSGPPPLEDGKPRPFAALANVGLFSSPGEPPIVPDVMLNLDVAVADDLQPKENQSYFIWCFGKPPEVAIELVSSREGGELGPKLQRYRRIRVAYYVVYDPLGRLGGAAVRTYELRGDLYVPIERPWFEGVGLGLVEWEGSFEGTKGTWLRWCTRDGALIPTGAERAETAEARAETAEARAETAEARAETAEARATRLLAKLRAAGIDPDADG
jgi:hypothetical protein